MQICRPKTKQKIQFLYAVSWRLRVWYLHAWIWYTSLQSQSISCGGLLSHRLPSCIMTKSVNYPAVFFVMRRDEDYEREEREEEKNAENRKLSRQGWVGEVQRGLYYVACRAVIIHRTVWLIYGFSRLFIFVTSLQQHFSLMSNNSSLHLLPPPPAGSCRCYLYFLFADTDITSLALRPSVISVSLHRFHHRSLSRFFSREFWNGYIDGQKSN